MVDIERFHEIGCFWNHLLIEAIEANRNRSSLYSRPVEDIL